VTKPPTARLPVPTNPPPEDGILRYLGFDGCVRLATRVDAQRLADEIDRLPPAAWVDPGRDPVVHASVESFFAVGHPRGPRPLPPEDRPVLDALPYLREVLREAFPASPVRAIVARLCAGGLIPIHTDTPRFFRGTVRLSIQIAAEGVQRLSCNHLWYDMAPGEVWAIDNLKPHGIHNPGTRPRTNLIADYQPTDELARLIAEGDDGLGVADAAALATIESMTKERYRKYRWQSIRYELFKLVWRRWGVRWPAGS